MVARVEKQRKAICQVLTADKKKHLALPWQQTDLLGVHEQYSHCSLETSHNTLTPQKIKNYFKCFKSVHLSESVDKDLVTKENAVTSY